MRTSPAAMTAVFLALAVVLGGCTRARPPAREGRGTATVTRGTTTASAVPAPAQAGVGPTDTPRPPSRATTVATQPTPTLAEDFGDLAGSAQVTPTPLPPTPLPTPLPPTPLPTPLPPTPLPPPLMPPTPFPPTPAPAPPVAPYVPPAGATYVVRWGDTLVSIAQAFGVSVDAIKMANQLTSDLILVGQELIIPGAGGAPAGQGASIVHVVEPGETMFRIALRYGTTVEALAQANGIANPWFIYVGQELTIPVTGKGFPASAGQTCVVQAGDTLGSIAMRYNTTIQELMVINNLSSPNLIYEGQTLRLP